MATFLLLTAGLIALDVVSWFRTAPVRRGNILRTRDPPKGVVSFSTSRATFLPSTAGAAAAAWGLAGILSADGPALALDFGLVAAGAFIVVTGLLSRVTSVQANQDGLVVTMARRPSFHTSWDELQALVAPATPLGRWRLKGGGGKQSTLMPSDVWGHEDVLGLIQIRLTPVSQGRST